MRQPAWYHYVGVLALAGVAYLVVLATASPSRPANVRAPDRPPPPVPLRVGVPPAVDPAPVPPTPPQQFTPHEQAILDGLNLYAGFECGIYTLEEKQQFQQQVVQRKRAAEAAGGNTPAAFPQYLRMLTLDRPRDLSSELSVMRKVAEIPGDRAAFRKPAVDRLNDPDLHMAMAAMKLLVQIATPEDVPAVVERFVTIEYDDRVEPRDHAYFAEGLKILAKFGGVAEITALDKAKAEHLLANDAAFWAKAEACKTAIRERLAKEKADKK